MADGSDFVPLCGRESVTRARAFDFTERPGGGRAHVLIVVLHRDEPDLQHRIVECDAERAHRPRVVDFAQSPRRGATYLRRAVTQRASQRVDRDLVFDFSERPRGGHANGRTVVARERISEWIDAARVLELTQPERAGLAQVGPRIAEQAEEEVVRPGAAVVTEDAGGDVADAAIAVANDGAEGAQHRRVKLVSLPTHLDVHPTTAARHRHRSRHRLRHRHDRIAEYTPPGAPEPAVVGERFAGERADGRVAGAELA